MTRNRAEPAATVQRKAGARQESRKLPAAAWGFEFRDEAKYQAAEGDGFACRYCGETDDLSIDHVVPRSQGGGDEETNLVVSCVSCNSSKGPRTPQQAGMRLLPRRSVRENCSR